MTEFDRRITAARPDRAAEALRGKVQAAAFVTGRILGVLAPVTGLRRTPSLTAALETEALLGEAVTVFEEAGDWAWGQLANDGYVGYLCRDDLGAWTQPTHRIGVPRSFVYPGASIKLPVCAALSLNAAVHIIETQADFAVLADGGCIFAAHLVPCTHQAADFVSVAESLLHTPYLWGGKTSLGLDCSGLVQMALAAAGIRAPRDSDMQEAALGTALPVDAVLHGLRRGDLVFWKGHVGIMRDPQTLLHASGNCMQVTSEPLALARDRIAAKGSGAITSVRRL